MLKFMSGIFREARNEFEEEKREKKNIAPVTSPSFWLFPRSLNER